ncbi:MAG: hypothetical protein ABSA69_06370, partial [Verrucomicrobiota bacterium]
PLTEVVSSSPTKNTTKTIQPPLFNATVAHLKQLQTIQEVNLDPTTPKSHLRNRADSLAKDSGVTRLSALLVDFTALIL